MPSRELSHILAAVIILAVVLSFAPLLNQNYSLIPQMLFFSVIIILVPIIAKKLMAYHLDADVEHEIWFWQRFGFKVKSKFRKPIPAGIIFPLFFSIFSLGLIKLMTLLTYESRALKTRAAKRHGFYSFTEMTEWHHGLIGAAGILSLLLLSILAYFLPLPGLETLAKLATFYAFWNLIPVSKLDGAQIFFGSRTLYTLLAAITLIFTAYALMLV